MGAAKEALARREAQFKVIDERTVALRNDLTKRIEESREIVFRADGELTEARAAVAGLESALAMARRDVNQKQATFIRAQATGLAYEHVRREIEGLEDGEMQCPF